MLPDSRGPKDGLLVLEVADSSIEYDRTVKARLYAEANIPEYWLLDLNEDVLHVYVDPKEGAYWAIRQYRRGDSVAPLAFPRLEVTVDSLLG